MKLSEIEFKNTSDLVTLTSTQVEETVKGYKLVFFPENSYKIERKTKLPMFVPAFYDWVIKQKSVPTQDEFWLHYLKKNKKYFDVKEFEGFEFLAVRARAYRTYPSLVRDLHFMLFLKEKFKKSTVNYSAKLDIEYGIDILIVNNNDNFAVSLLANTERAKEAREWKVNRHGKLEDVTYVDIIVDNMETPNFGEFFLFHDTEAKRLASELISNATRIRTERLATEKV